MVSSWDLWQMTRMLARISAGSILIIILRSMAMWQQYGYAFPSLRIPLDQYDYSYDHSTWLCASGIPHLICSSLQVVIF